MTSKPQVKHKRRSKLWYLLPIFLHVVGGLIVYFKLKNSDSIIARNALLLGIILSGLTTAIVLYVYLDYQSYMLAANERIANGSPVANTAFGPIQYADFGHGYPVLVVHGAGGGYDQGVIISRVFLDENDFHVIAPSRFGFLHTPVPGGDNKNSSFAAQADVYAELLDKLNIKKVAVLGFSAGGPSSLEFALRHPDRTSVLVLISPVVHQEPPQGFMDKIMHYGIFKSDFVFWFIAKYFEPNLISFFGVSPEVQAKLSPEEKSWLSDVLIPSMFPISQRQPGMANDRINFSLIDYQLEQINVPTLVIHAKDDTLVNPSHSEYAAQRIPNVMHVEFDAGGHLLVGHKQDVKSAIMDFLTEHNVTETAATEATQ
jgi:2-hydroxy-6-oxonona-2,4-dienedioate hydrolase